jgi:hypothetical protein
MPKVPKVGRPDFEAKCRVKVLPIVEQGRRTSNEGATTHEWWTRHTPIRTTTHLLEEADQADGCPATSLVVNSNLGEAKFE